MQNILDYIYSNNDVTYSVVEESLQLVNEEGWTMKDVYETLFIDEIYGDQLNEGWFGDKLRKLAGKADKAEDKARETIGKAKEGIKNAKDAIVAKFEEWSQEAKDAYNQLKEWAGKKWDALKEGVEEVIGKIEGAFAKVKDAISSVIKTIGKVGKDIALTTAGLLVILIKGIISMTKKGAKAVEKLFNDTKMFFGNAILVLGIVVGQKVGFDKDYESYQVALAFGE